jgi:hypothetical protein
MDAEAEISSTRLLRNFQKLELHKYKMAIVASLLSVVQMLESLLSSTLSPVKVGQSLMTLREQRVIQLMN